MNLDLFGADGAEEGGAETPPLPSPVPSGAGTSGDGAQAVATPAEGPRASGSVNAEAGAPAPELAPMAAPVPPAPPLPVVWSVSQVNQVVRALLEDSLPPLWVSGEVANWTRARSGHCYFTLKDEVAQLRCVLWRAEAARLPMDPEQGMRIRVFGQLTLYEARGEYQLVARVLEGEEGEGLWKLAFESLRKRLLEEGLLAPERKRPLPRFPRTVGVVTSLTGAALHDILTVLHRRAPWLRVLVRGARVQGEGAAQEIAEALRVLGGSGLVDVVIVGRGGGSLEDLWAFNEEPVARAVARCPVPVISAVGHEVDVTISDLVADWRAPTPSAAAEAVAPDQEEILRSVQGAGVRLARGLRRVVDRPRRALATARLGLRRAARALTARQRQVAANARARLRWLGPRLTARPRRTVEDGGRRLAVALRALLASRRAELARHAAKMDALSPLATLRRGYAVPLDLEGRVLRGVEEFVAGKDFHLRVVDGRVRCRTTDRMKEEVRGA